MLALTPILVFLLASGNRVAPRGVGAGSCSQAVGLIAINRNAWSQSIGISGRDQPVRAAEIVETHARKAGPLGNSPPQTVQIGARRFILVAGSFAGDNER